MPKVNKSEINESRIKIGIKRKADESYCVNFGENLFPIIAHDLEQMQLDATYAIITDSNVHKLYGHSLYSALSTKSLNVGIISLEAGEKSKNIETCMQIVNEMHKMDFRRDSVILALGGGVVGDLAGFIAANFDRGIPYIQIPTTLMAQVDSSIGGKTAVNTENGKNLFGAFKQPKAVYTDFSLLKTLPGKEFSNGMAEVIKYGVIKNAEFFEKLESFDKYALKNMKNLEYIVKECVRIKANIVERDPYESHSSRIRSILNYGHTIGHAVEKLAGYDIPHGEAVSIGMMAEGLIATALHTGFTKKDLERQRVLLKKVGFHLIIPAGITNDSIIKETYKDKKAENAQPRYCLPRGIGAMCSSAGKYTLPVDDKVVNEALNDARSIDCFIY